MNPLLDHMRNHACWVIGKGDTLAQDCCWAMGIPCPESIRDLSMQQVLQTSSLKSSFLAAVPSRLHGAFLNYVPSLSPDRLVWTGNSVGYFSTKAFRNSYLPQFSNVGWGDKIWQPWIPSRISCFVWKLCHMAIATDDNIKRISISLASRCLCCKQQEEDIEHLFFQGAWAVKAWMFLSNSLGVVKPACLSAFKNGNIGKKPRNYLEGLRLGAACFCVWEVWRARNLAIYEHKNHDIVGAVIRWIRSISQRINLPSGSTHSRIAAIFGLPGQPWVRSSGSWRSWSPSPVGVTANVTCMHGRCGIIIRSSDGVFLRACVAVLPDSFGMLALLRGIVKAIQLCNSQVISVQSSSIFMGDILFGKEASLPWESIMERRAFFAQWGQVFLQKINAGQNNSSICLVCLANPGVYVCVSELPRQVQLALHDEKTGIDRFCTFFDSL